MSHLARTRPPVDKYAAASAFYEEKLAANPTMPRYNHFMGAISAAKGNNAAADNYYRQTISATPHDVMARNDFAIHLANQNRKEDSLQEFKKAVLIVEDNAVLQKNMGAVLGNSGQYKPALEAATRARHLNPHDAMNHRNLAKLHAALGDSRTSLEHNMASIHLENPAAIVANGYNRSAPKPVTSAYRAAAVQIIARGGRREEAHKLMDIARTLEHKTYVLDTTQRTNEIIYAALKRKGDQVAQLEMERAAEEAKKVVADLSFGGKADILKFTAQMSRARDRAADEDGDGDEEEEEDNSVTRRRRRRKKPV